MFFVEIGTLGRSRGAPTSRAAAPPSMAARISRSYVFQHSALLGSPGLGVRLTLGGCDQIRKLSMYPTVFGMVAVPPRAPL